MMVLSQLCLRTIYYIFVLLVMLAGALPVLAQNTKISGSLQADGNVAHNSDDLPDNPFLLSAYEITPDGQSVIYMADAETDGFVELYRAPIAGGEVAKLSDPAIVTGNVFEFLISPDSQYVVFAAGPSGEFQLYSAPVTEGEPVRLREDLPAGSQITVGGGFRISPDSTRVVYTLDQSSFKSEIFSVSITGGASTKLNGELVNGSSVAQYPHITNGGRVVYSADQDTDDLTELYSVPLTGGEPIKLNVPLTSSSDVRHVNLNSDGVHVVYSVLREADNAYDIYSVPVSGGVSIKLSETLRIDEVHSWLRIQISPDSNWVVYHGIHEPGGVFELYSVPITGGAVTRLNGPLAAGIDINDYFQISANSSRVVFMVQNALQTRGQQGANEERGLYSVPIAGGAAAQLSPLLASDEYLPHFVLSPNSAHVAFLLNQDGRDDLYSAPLAGGEFIQIHDAEAAQFANAGVDLTFSVDGNYVLYRTTRLSGHDELYQAPSAGGAPIKLNGPLVSDGQSRYGRVVDFRTALANNQVVYRADQEIFGKFELYLGEEQDTAPPPDAQLYLPYVSR
jgi:Tol biopolymer transport system component